MLHIHKYLCTYCMHVKYVFLIQEKTRHRKCLLFFIYYKLLDDSRPTHVLLFVMIIFQISHNHRVYMVRQSKYNSGNINPS